MTDERHQTYQAFLKCPWCGLIKDLTPEEAEDVMFSDESYLYFDDLFEKCSCGTSYGKNSSLLFRRV